GCGGRSGARAWGHAGAGAAPPPANGRAPLLGTATCPSLWCKAPRRSPPVHKACAPIDADRPRLRRWSAGPAYAQACSYMSWLRKLTTFCRNATCRRQGRGPRRTPFRRFNCCSPAIPAPLAIVRLSLIVSLSAVVFGGLIGVPSGAAVALIRFPGREAVIVILNALMGLPPVVVGLAIYLLLSRSGPL